MNPFRRRRRRPRPYESTGAGLPMRYRDHVVDVQLRAETYPYGNDRPGTGVQVTLTSAEHTIAVRMPGPTARLLALAILGDLPPT